MRKMTESGSPGISPYKRCRSYLQALSRACRGIISILVAGLADFSDNHNTIMLCSIYTSGGVRDCQLKDSRRGSTGFLVRHIQTARVTSYCMMEVKASLKVWSKDPVCSVAMGY